MKAIRNEPVKAQRKTKLSKNSPMMKKVKGDLNDIASGGGPNGAGKGDACRIGSREDFNEGHDLINWNSERGG